jgi:hypothetical protein
MQNGGMMLELHTERRAGCTHNSIIIALRLNCRRCSDHLEIHRTRGYARALRDRRLRSEIIAGSVAANGGVTGELVRDLRVARFNAAKKSRMESSDFPTMETPISPQTAPT